MTWSALSSQSSVKTNSKSFILSSAFAIINSILMEVRFPEVHLQFDFEDFNYLIQQNTIGFPFLLFATTNKYSFILKSSKVRVKIPPINKVSKYWQASPVATSIPLSLKNLAKKSSQEVWRTFKTNVICVTPVQGSELKIRERFTSNSQVPSSLELRIL